MQDTDELTPDTAVAETPYAQHRTRRVETLQNAAELGVGLLAAAGVFIVVTLGTCLALAFAFFEGFDDCYPRECGAMLLAPNGAVRASEWSQACGGVLGDDYTHVTLTDVASGKHKQVFRAPVYGVEMHWERADLFIIHIRDTCPNDLRQHISGVRTWRGIAIRIVLERVRALNGAYVAGC